MAKKRLYRSRENRVIAGVCGGIGEYFDIDPTIVRLIWVLSILVGGFGLLAYIISIFIIPDKSGTRKPKKKVKGFGHVKKMGTDFVEFLKKYKIIGLAVAFIMAAYVGALVNSVVGDLIFPLLEYLPGFDSITDETATWQDWPFTSPIRLGCLLASIVTFIIVAFVIFWIVKLAKKVGLE